jgi:outer membrane protein assembly factor BamB
MRNLPLSAVVLGILCFLPSVPVFAADWPQYRGPDQTGTTAEKVLLDWQAGGPKLLWKIPTPNGFSSFAVSGGKAYTQVNRDIDGQPRELCVALDALTGKELWSADVGEGHYPGGGDTGAPGNDGGDGPRSTPTIDDGRVYVATPNLVFYCLDPSTGQPIWTKDLIKEHAGRNIGWKSAASPVIDGNLLFLGGGGRGQSLLALDKKTGKVVWKGFDEHITHATPVVTTILGRRQVIFFLQSGLLSVAAEDGKALWKFPVRYNISTAASPVVSGDIVYCGVGYGVGGAACRISSTAEGFQATELWRVSGNDKVVSHWSTPVCKDGYLYGMFSFKKFGAGPMKCVEIATGRIAWQQPGFGPGNVILAGDRLLALADDGRLLVVEATPERYHEIARAKVLTGKCWSTPALSDGRIFVRSTKEGACLALTGG